MKEEASLKFDLDSWVLPNRNNRSGGSEHFEVQVRSIL